MDRVLKAAMSPQCGLTRAVRRVFEFRAVGMTLDEIAKFLHRSIKTIDRQNSDALQELGARNVQEAVAKATAEGWLTFQFVARKLVLLAFLSGVSGHALSAGEWLLDDNPDQQQQRVRQVRLTRYRPLRSRELIG